MFSPFFAILLFKRAGWLKRVEKISSYPLPKKRSTPQRGSQNSLERKKSHINSHHLDWKKNETRQKTISLKGMNARSGRKNLDFFGSIFFVFGSLVESAGLFHIIGQRRPFVLFLGTNKGQEQIKRNPMVFSENKREANKQFHQVIFMITRLRVLWCEIHKVINWT